MSAKVENAIKRCGEKLEKIIRRKIPLRNPSIAIIDCSEKNIKEIYIQYISLLKKLRESNPSWTYDVINAEKLLFDILKRFDYIDGDCDAKTCSRNAFADNLKGSIKDELLKKVEEKIQILLNSHQPEQSPPFLIILNMHACYNYIQTRNLIVQLSSVQKVLVLILYLQRDRESTLEKEAIKQANYNVNSYTLINNL